MMTPTNSGAPMATTLKPRSPRLEYIPSDRVTVVEAFRRQMGLRTQAAAHRRLYVEPTIKEQACALARAYQLAGAPAEGQQFLQAVQAAAKPESHRPFGTEIMVQLASAEAGEQVARQSLSMVRCRSTAVAWRQKAFREVAEILGTISAVEQEFGL